MTQQASSQVKNSPFLQGLFTISANPLNAFYNQMLDMHREIGAVLDHINDAAKGQTVFTIDDFDMESPNITLRVETQKHAKPQRTNRYISAKQVTSRGTVENIRITTADAPTPGAYATESNMDILTLDQTSALLQQFVYENMPGQMQMLMQRKVAAKAATTQPAIGTNNSNGAPTVSTPTNP